MNELKTEGNNKTGKKTKIIYWSLTSFVALGFLMSSFMYLTQAPELMENFSKVGFPVFL